MKNLQRIAYRLFASVFLLLFSITVYSQTPEQRAFLQALSDELAEQYNIRREAAIGKADSLGLPVRMEIGYGVIELQDFLNGIPLYYTTYNLEGAQVIKSSEVWSGGGAGLGLSGAGQTLGMWDGGATRLSHQEFQGRVVQADNATSLSAHATHVAATMVAGGVQNAAKGMSFQANLDAYDWNNDLSEMAEAASLGLRVSQHSYGFITGWRYDGSDWYWYGNTSISETEDYRFGFYDANAQIWDQIANNAPYYLIVKSAGNDRGSGPAPGTGHYVINGNQWEWSTQIRDIDGGDDGYDCISTNGNAKNIMTVGAVNASGDMSNFSGWGPTDDGRIKPDIVAKGVGVYSATSQSNTSYDTWNGTSMSGPMISGSVGLLLEHHENLHGPSAPLRSSTMKALIIHTAQQMGNHPGPDYRNGWGLMNTRKAAEVMTENAEIGIPFNIRELTLNEGQTIEISVVSDGTSPLKATLAWNDPAAVPPPPSLNPEISMLVNDLDMRIIHNQETFYYPWILDPSNPSLVATTGDNFRDNVEQIFIQNPIAGETYTITIGHKGSLAGLNQDFSLIITGIATEGLFNTVTFNVTDQYGTPLENAMISIMADTNRESEIFTFKEKTDNVFERTFIDRSEDETVKTLFHSDEQNQNQTIFSHQKNEEEWIHWDNGQNHTGIGTNSSATFSIASRWEPSDLTDYDGMQISKISFFPGYDDCTYTLKIWTGPNATEVYSQVINNVNIDEWNIQELHHPFTIDASVELWFGLSINTQGGFPAGCDEGPEVAGKGNMIFWNGEWNELTELNDELTFNWNLQAMVKAPEPIILFTDASGMVSFEALNGSYSFIAEKEGYSSVEESFIVDGDAISIPVILQGETLTFTLDISANPQDGGFVSGAGQYEPGEEVLVNANPAATFEFVNWTDEEDNIISIQPEFIFTMPAEDVELTAHFALATYAVTVNIEPEGAGTVNGAGTYSMGDEVTLEAIAAEGYEFVNWMDADGNEVSGETTYIFSMPANDIELTAHFALATYTVTVNIEPEGAGTVTGAGTYSMGDEVTLEAISAEGYEFVNWMDAGGNEVSGETTYIFSMPAEDIVLTVNFIEEGFAVSVNIEPEYGGIVTGEGIYYYGEVVSLKALANPGFIFVMWTNIDGLVISDDETYNFFMPPYNVELTAHFIPAEYEVAVNIEPEAAGTVTGIGTYNMNNEVTLEANAHDGYIFMHWKDIDDQELSGNPIYTFLMPMHDVLFTAYFDIADVIGEEEFNEIKIFPNPALDQINIFSGNMMYRIEITDISGRIIRFENVEDTKTRISVDGFDNGVYIVRIYLNEGVQTKKIVIQN